MNKKDVINIIENTDIYEKINLADIPELDLYMDQVIQLFENRLGNLKRNEDEKILTKTMINNYAKAKLLMSIKNKKYSKEHLVLISMIYELKGSLSINDIKSMLDNIVEKFENGEDYDLRRLYEAYLRISEEDYNKIEVDIKDKVDKISDGEISYEDKFLLVSSIISMSNMYRKIGEKLIDEFFGDNKEK